MRAGAEPGRERPPLPFPLAISSVASIRAGSRRVVARVTLMRGSMGKVTGCVRVEVIGRALAMVAVVAALTLSSLWGWDRPRACVTGFIDLRLRDQDERWGNGVGGTWKVLDMAPGKEYPLEASFLQLRQAGMLCPDHLEIAVSYSLDKPTGGIPANPDALADKVILSRLEYWNNRWNINLLSGQASGNPPRPSGYRPEDWRVSDTDGDGKVTLKDLRNDPLDDLPPPQPWMTDADYPYMRLSVKFDPGAGSELMGLGIRADFTYTLNQFSWQ